MLVCRKLVIYAEIWRSYWWEYSAHKSVVYHACVKVPKTTITVSFTRTLRTPHIVVLRANISYGHVLRMHCWVKEEDRVGS